MLGMLVFEIVPGAKIVDSSVPVNIKRERDARKQTSYLKPLFETEMRGSVCISIASKCHIRSDYPALLG
jgi:hypothetical protein